jgi:sialic acid synthase SpsE
VILLAGSADPAATPDVTSMSALAERFGTLVGWQDVRPGHVLAVGAAALGASIVMKAFTDRSGAATPDATLGPDEFSRMVAAVRELEASCGPAGVGPTRRRLPVAGPVLRGDGTPRPRPQLGTGRGGR